MIRTVLFLIGFVSCYAEMMIPGGTEPFTVKLSQKKPALPSGFTEHSLIHCEPGFTALTELQSDLKTVMVFPKSFIPSDTRFQCTLADSQRVTLVTHPFQLIEVSEINHPHAYAFSFSDRIDQNTIKSSLRLYCDNERVDRSSKIETGGTGFTIVPPACNGTLNLKLNSSLHSETGTALKPVNLSFEKQQMADSFADNDSRTSLPLLDKPESVELDNGKIDLRLWFPEALINEDPSAYIKITPSIAFQAGKSRYRWYWGNRSENKVSHYYVDLKGDFQPESRYEIELKPGLKTKSFLLMQSVKYAVVTGKRVPSASFVNDLPYLTRGGAGTEIKAANLDSVHMVIERLLPQNRQFFLQFERDSSWKFSSMSRVIFSGDVKLTQNHGNFSSYSLSLDELEKEEGGIYRVMLYSAPDKDGERRFLDDKLIFHSDFGIAAKLHKNGLLVSVSELKTAESVKNARIKVYSSKNELIAMGSSDKDGLWSYEFAEFSQREPKLLVVSSDKKEGFLLLSAPLENISGTIHNNPDIKVLCSLERNLYRPGETIKGALVFRDGFKGLSQDVPVKVKLMNSLNNLVSQKVYHLDRNSTLSFSYKTDSFSPTGLYTLKAYISNHELGSFEIKVEDFVAPGIESEIELDSSYFFRGDNISLKGSGRWLFGAPAANQRCEMEISFTESDFKTKEYDGYVFKASESKQKSNPQPVKFTGILDESGMFRTVMKTSQIKGRPGVIYRANILFTVFEENRPVYRTSSFLLLPGARVAGIKPHFDTDYASQNEIRFSTVLYDVKLNKPVVDAMLGWELYRVVWRTNYSDNGYGSWYETRQRVSSGTLESGAVFNPQLPHGGSYILVLKDLLNHGHYSEVKFYVSEWKTNEIQSSESLVGLKFLHSDREYLPSETMDFTVVAPFPGRILFTVESNGIKSAFVEQMDSLTKKFSITVPQANSSPYLTAWLIRGTDSKDKMLPYRASGKMKIPLDFSGRKLGFHLKSTDRSLSATSLSISLVSDEDATGFISLVDEGIHQLGGYNEKDYFKELSKSTMHGVVTYDLYKSLDPGADQVTRLRFGGDGQARRTKHLTPTDFNRTSKPVSFYSGPVSLKAGESKSLSFDIPRFSGRIRVAALMVSKNSLASAYKQVEIKDPLIIKATGPLFLYQGDKVKVPVQVFNASNTLKPVTISTDCKNISCEMGPKNVLVSGGGSYSFTLDVGASEAGQSTIKILADSKDYNTEFIWNLPVHEKESIRTISGMDSSNDELRVSIPGEFVENQKSASVFVRFGNPFQLLMDSRASYVLSYPHGCAEQTASKILAAGSVNHLSQYSDEELAKLKKAWLSEGSRKLLSMMNSQGGFKLYSGSQNENLYISLYCADVLLQASREGFISLPKNKRNLLLDSLRTTVGKFQGRGSESRKASLYAAWILSENQALSAGWRNSIDEMQPIDGLEAAFMLSLTSLPSRRAALLYNVKDSIPGTLGYMWESYITAKSMQAYLLRNIYIDEAKEILRSLTVDTRNLQYLSTHESAWLYRALSKVLTTLDTKAQKLKIVEPDLVLDKEHSWKRFPFTGSRLSFQPYPQQSSYTVSYEISGRARFPQGEHGNGISLWVKFVDEDGKSVDRFHVGDRVYQDISISLNQSSLSQIVMVEKFPSCFEPVNTRLNSGSDTAGTLPPVLHSMDIRESRRLYYFDADSKKVSWRQPLRVVTQGMFECPVSQVEAMYDPIKSDFAAACRQLRVD